MTEAAEKRKSPRANTPDPLVRGLQKTEAVLLWVNAWHFTTVTVLAEHLQITSVNASNLVGRLTKKHLLRRVECEALEGADLFMLTPDGQEEAECAGAAAWNYDTRPSAINHDMVRHDIGVQWLTANAINRLKEHGIEISEILPDHVERAKGATLGRKIPDCTLICATGEKYAIEFERSEKTGQQLHRFLLDTARLVGGQNPEFDKVLVFSRKEALIKNYEKAIKEPIINYAKDPTQNKWVAVKEKDNSGTIRRDENNQPIVKKTKIKPETLAKIKFSFKPEIEAAINPQKWKTKKRRIEQEAKEKEAKNKRLEQYKEIENSHEKEI